MTRRSFHLGWTAAIAVHLLGVAHLLRGLSFTGAFPILTCDYAMYFARILRANAFWASSHRLWGYDPFLMAGYPSGTVHELGSHVLTVAGMVLNRLPFFPQSLTLLESALLASIPFSVAAFAALVGLGRRASLMAFVLAASFYGTFGLVSAQLVSLGFLPFQAALCLSLVAVGLFHRWLVVRSTAAFAAFAATTALVPFFHLAAGLSTIPPLVALYLIHFRRINRKEQAMIGAAVLGALALNFHWIRPYLHFSNWIVTGQVDGGMLLTMAWRRAGVFQRSWAGVITSTFYFYLAVFFFSGLVALWRDRRDVSITVAVWFACAVSVPFALHMGGPWRFFLMAELLGCLVAAYGMYDGIGGAIPPRVITGLLMVACSATLFQWHQFSKGGVYRHLVDRLPENESQVIDYLKTQDHSEGRFLVECGLGTDPDFIDVAPLLTGASILGGSNAANFLKSRFTVFSGVDGLSTNWSPGYRPAVFGRDLANTDEEDFSRHLALYNVHQILVWSKPAADELTRFTKTLAFVEKLGGYSVWRVKTPATWFVVGSGAVAPAYDHLRVSHLSSGRSVLSFHWIDTLRVAPPLTIRPVTLPDSPLAFIEIDNPSGATDADIFNAGI